MKIVFDHVPGEDLEQHARYLHHQMMRDKKLPRVAAATRAMVPDWCDDCGGHSWGPVMGGASYCRACQTKREGKAELGFAS